jgi:hypothetical protein
MLNIRRPVGVEVSIAWSRTFSVTPCGEESTKSAASSNPTRWAYMNLFEKL